MQRPGHRSFSKLCIAAASRQPDHPEHTFTLQVSATLAARLPEFNGQDIVFAAFACSQLRHVDDALPHAIAAELESRGVMSFKVSCPATNCPKLGRCSIIVSAVASSRVSELFLSELLSLPARVVRQELIHTTHPGLVPRKALVTN